MYFLPVETALLKAVDYLFILVFFSAPLPNQQELLLFILILVKEFSLLGKEELKETYKES